PKRLARIRKSRIRCRPARWPGPRWTCTEPDGEARTCILAPSPADADAPAVEPAPHSEVDLRGADQIFAQEPAPITLDAWLETSAPSPEEDHTIEQRRDFYATPCRLGQLGGADLWRASHERA
ncbi:MAG: hypothetical protein JO252_02080, partial [Planctomycetaceae bacterium]|nr:hypothetical protein [Planctomycetaceae bacterium]